MTTDSPQPPEQAATPAHSFRDKTQEAPDLVRLHKRVVAREQIEPAEGNEQTPWWLWTFSVLLLFAMGFYLGHYGGSFSAAVHEVEEPPARAAGPTAPPEAPRGDMVFVGICQPCHQSSGMGIPGQYPPLAGSDWLLGPADVPIRIVLYGLSGEIRVKGASFNNTMPPLRDQLSHAEIAAVLTYVRSSWGNQAPAVTVAEVDSVAKATGERSPMAPQELKQPAR